MPQAHGCAGAAPAVAGEGTHSDTSQITDSSLASIRSEVGVPFSGQPTTTAWTQEVEQRREQLPS
jgi:hypothetical protein